MQERPTSFGAGSSLPNLEFVTLKYDCLFHEGPPVGNHSPSPTLAGSLAPDRSRLVR